MATTEHLLIGQDSDSKIDDIALWTEITICVTVAIIDIATNTITILAVATRRKLQTTANAYVVSLAVADLLIGVSAGVRIFELLPSAAESMKQNKWACLIQLSIVYSLVAVSTISMLIIAFDRFYFVEYALQYPVRMTMSRVGYIIMSSWVAGAIYGTVPLYENHFDVDIGCAPTHIIDRQYMTIAHPILFFSISAASAVLYALIMNRVKGHLQTIQNQEAAILGMTTAAEIKTRRNNYKAVKMLSMVFGLFFISWGPLIIVALLEYTIHVPHVYLTVCSGVVICHSAINFFVYAFMNRDFRFAFKSMFCSWKSNTSSVHPVSTNKRRIALCHY